MRGTLFTIVYYILSTVYVLVSVPFLIVITSYSIHYTKLYEWTSSTQVQR